MVVACIWRIAWSEGNGCEHGMFVDVNKNNISFTPVKKWDKETIHHRKLAWARKQSSWNVRIGPVLLRHWPLCSWSLDWDVFIRDIGVYLATDKNDFFVLGFPPNCTMHNKSIPLVKPDGRLALHTWRRPRIGKNAIRAPLNEIQSLHKNVGYMTVYWVSWCNVI